MPINETKIPVTTPEQKRSVGRAGEGLTIDKNTFEIKGVDTGTVFGQGTNLQEALALQTAIQSGSSPTVAGRPDLLAVEQRPGIAVETITGAGGQQVQPTVATPDQLAQASAGTLPSFDAVTGAKPAVAPLVPSLAPEPPKPPTNFADAMQATLKAGAEAKKAELLGAPDSYDNQILRQKAAMMSKMFGQDLTPDDLKWLTPAQSQAVLSGDETLIKAEIAALNTITTGRKEMKKEAAERADKQMALFLESGTPVDQLPADFLDSLDEAQGVPKGLHASIYKSKVAANEAEKEAAQVESAQKMISLLKDIPAGQEVVINGTTYTGFGTSGIQSGMEVDASGNGTIWSYNQLTGDHSIIDIGQVGAGQGWEMKTSSSGVRYLENKNTGERKLAQNGGDPNGGTASGLVAVFPDRSVTPFNRSSKGDIASTSYKETDRWWAAQCGAWVNDITGLGLGDTYASKQAKMDTSITTENARVGDVFITPYAGTGHTGVINSVYEIDGEKYFRVSESNWEKDANGIGLITHSRSIKASTVGGFARPGFKDPKYSFGTDSGNQDLYALDEAPQEADVKDVTDLRTKFVSEAGAYIKIRDAFSKVQSSATNPSPAGDLSLIFNYMKILDPGSTVMQGEQTTAQNIGNIPANIASQYNKLLGSGESLSSEKRADFLAQAERLYATQYDAFKPILDIYTKEARELNVEPERIVGSVYVPDSSITGGQTGALDYRAVFGQLPSEWQSLITEYRNRGLTDEKIYQQLNSRGIFN